jgi:3-deoxy-D-manno-octulosonic-acid transferase
MIIAPHEMTTAHLQAIEEWAAEQHLTFARVDAADANTDVVIVDRFGILGDLYALAGIAFVGGGFHDAGLHSVLEPAAFGAPVLFGPKHHRSRDAMMLLEVGGSAVVNTAADIAQRLVRWVDQPSERRDAGAKALAAVERGRGAAERSLKLVERLLA